MSTSSCVFDTSDSDSLNTEGQIYDLAMDSLQCAPPTSSRKKAKNMLPAWVPPTSPPLKNISCDNIAAAAVTPSSGNGSGTLLSTESGTCDQSNALFTGSTNGVHSRTRSQASVITPRRSLAQSSIGSGTCDQSNASFTGSMNGLPLCTCSQTSVVIKSSKNICGTQEKLCILRGDDSTSSATAIEMARASISSTGDAKESASVLEEYENREQEREDKQRRQDAAMAAENMSRSLSDDDLNRVQQALHGIGLLDDELASSATDSVMRKSFHTLRPTEWLNDEVIHYYLSMLTKRDDALSVANPGRKRSHFFKSFFFTKLFDEGVTNEYKYSNVKRWSKKVPGKDIFALDKILFACNVLSTHWTCVVIFMQEKRIQFYDSMRGDGYHYLDGLLQYLKDEWAVKKGGELPDADKWTVVGSETSVPQQTNGYDCGVFTCMYADFLSLDLPLSFNQGHIDHCRHHISLSILDGKIVLGEVDNAVHIQLDSDDLLIVKQEKKTKKTIRDIVEESPIYFDGKVDDSTDVKEQVGLADDESFANGVDEVEEYIKISSKSIKDKTDVKYGEDHHDVILDPRQKVDVTMAEKNEVSAATFMEPMKKSSTHKNHFRYLDIAESCELLQCFINAWKMRRCFISAQKNRRCRNGKRLVPCDYDCYRFTCSLIHYLVCRMILGAEPLHTKILARFKTLDAILSVTDPVETPNVNLSGTDATERQKRYLYKHIIAQVYSTVFDNNPKDGRIVQIMMSEKSQFSKCCHFVNRRVSLMKKGTWSDPNMKEQVCNCEWTVYRKFLEYIGIFPAQATSSERQQGLLSFKSDRFMRQVPAAPTQPPGTKNNKESNHLASPPKVHKKEQMESKSR